MTDNQRVERIRAALETALAPSALDISDDSAAHAGHAGALTGKGHFSVRIVAERFAGLPPLKRHRLVYAALEALLATDIHALSIDARAPQEG
ncbi:MAG: BolA family protein [Gammaproteobacteria bacterium]